MSARTNPTALASACRRLSRELSEESRRWTGQERKDLQANALQLGYTARTVNRQKPGVVEAIIDAATNVLVIAMTQRAFGVEARRD